METKLMKITSKATSFILSETLTFKGHNDEIENIYQLKDGKIATTSQDRTIIYNSTKQYQKQVTFKGHTDDVYSLCELSDGNIVSCSRDKTIKIWSITDNKYKCLFTIENAHASDIFKVISLPKNRIATCSKDSLIKIWKSDPQYCKEPISILKGPYTLSINSIFYHRQKDILISGEYYNTFLCFWNIKTYQCVSIITNVMCSEKRSIYQIDSKRIVIGGYNYLNIVDINKCKINHQEYFDGIGDIYPFY